MALAASAVAVQVPRALFATRARADHSGHHSSAGHHSLRARVSSAAASGLSSRLATPAPLKRTTRDLIRAAPLAASTAIMADASNDGDWNDEPTVNVPISFFSILNLSPARASPASIEAAYTSVIQRELVEGFSNSCLAARADLVDAAAQVISDPDLRAEHESDLKNGRLTPVPISQLGGALALMQEAGEHEAVIEYAPECLAAARSRVARRDITLSAALAHCELSHNALTATPPRVGEGCELLDIASKILIAEAGRSFSKELQETIDLTLREMAPAYVIELIAMPLEAKRERKAGVRALRHILWADPENALNDRDAYVVEVNRHLTSNEVVDLFLEAPESVPADAEEVYQSAMALMVVGYRERRPMLIVDADEMLAQLEQNAYLVAQEARAQAERLTRAAADAGQPPPNGAWATPPVQEPVNVERAVCQLLLGRVEDAAYSLGMGPDPTPYVLDPQVERFVTEHSPSGDWTEGLCALADRWISDVAFPSFRDSARVESVPTILQWFDEPGVQKFCNRFESSPVFAKTLAALDSGFRSAAQTAERIGDVLGGASDVPGLRAEGAVGAGVSMSRAGRRARIQRLMRENPGVANVAFLGTIVAGASLVAYGMADTRPSGSMSASVARVPGAPAIGKSPKDVGALLGAAATNVADGVAGAAASMSRKAPEVDVRVAEQIVRRWQNAKAQALGVAHNLRPLEQVLEGPMLQQWLTRAEDVKAHGWAWEYQLNALTVDKVEVMTSSRVMVEATLTEVAVLKDRARTEDDDRYESTYRARYELRKSDSVGGVRAWKIVGGSVVY
tara:strand:- start:10777 stop:13170 length:2394 start_codon:yes stop_codon:yes gene_type:complete